MKDNGIEQLPKIIQELYLIIRKLEEHFPGRHFTPDGHLVGSIGEVLAAYYYGLELLPASTAKHDARNPEGKLVQIKATQGNSIGLRSQPDYLLVLKILPTGKYDEIYNGPGRLAWENSGKMQTNGVQPIRVSKLIKLMEQVRIEDRIIKVSKD